MKHVSMEEVTSSQTSSAGGTKNSTDKKLVGAALMVAAGQVPKTHAVLSTNWLAMPTRGCCGQVSDVGVGEFW